MDKKFIIRREFMIGRQKIRHMYRMHDNKVVHLQNVWKVKTDIEFRKLEYELRQPPVRKRIK